MTNLKRKQIFGEEFERGDDASSNPTRGAVSNPFMGPLIREDHSYLYSPLRFINNFFYI